MSSKSWHCSEDIPIRLMILRKTYETFQKIHLPCDPEVFRSTLEELVPRLEVALYNNASTLEEYGDPKTVEGRLERIAPLHVQLQPLEVLWLQGLFAVTSPPSAFRFSQQDTGSSIAEGTILYPPSQQAAVLPLISMGPSQEQTQDLTAVPQSAVPYQSNQNEAYTTVSQTRDQYTQSLIELYQYLHNYDNTSDRRMSTDISFQEETRNQASSSRQNTASTDLLCHERIDDLVRK